MLGRCAIASGGRSAEAAVDALASLAEQLRPLDPERSLELGAELLMVATAVPRLRPGCAAHLQRFREQARGHPGFEAVARIHAAQEQLVHGRLGRGGRGGGAGGARAGLPPEPRRTPRSWRC